MFKVIIVIISILGGFSIGFFCFPNLDVWIRLLLSTGFTIAVFIGLVIFFFLWLFLDTFWVDTKKERKHQSKHCYAVIQKYYFFLHSIFGIKATYSGIEKLDKDQNYFFVCNHRSNFDTIVIDRYLKHYKIAYLAKKSLFKVPFIKHIISGLCYINLDRDDPKKDVRGILRAISLMKSEDKISIGVFPEGTRNINDPKKLLDFKAGCFNVPLRAKKPIVIMSLIGTREIQNNLIFKKHPVSLTILEVLQYEDYKNMSTAQIADYCKNKIENYVKENLK